MNSDQLINYRHLDLQTNVDTAWMADVNAVIPQTFSERATLVASVMEGARTGTARPTP